MARATRIGHWRDDLRGGATAELIAAPLCISYGLLAWAPLGPDYAGMGVLAGLLAGCCAPLIAALLGQRDPRIFIARSVSNVVLGAFLAEFAATLPGPMTPGLAAQAVLLFVLLVGLLELLFGIARVGTLAKFLPAPVTAGFQCGVALVLLVSQIGGVLGVEHPGRGLAGFTHLGEARPLAAALALLTLACAVLVNRWSRRAPAFLIALGVATVAQALLQALGAGPWLGPTMGALPFLVPQFTALAHLGDPGTTTLFWPLLPTIFSWALTAAVISTAEGLISLRVVEDFTERRIDPRRELLHLGGANVVGALCGAVHVGVSTPATATAVQAGATSARANVAAAVTLILLSVVLAPLFGLVPQAAIAAMLVLVALRMFEPWTVQVSAALVRGELRADRHLLAMIGTVTLVAGLALLWNFFVAVGTGLTLAVAAFLWRMSRTIVRRHYTGREVQSRNLRAPEARELLARHGERITVFELEGPLFFGTGEKLGAGIDALPAHATRVVIVDLRRLNDVDSTGARILIRAASNLARRDQFLVLAGVPRGGRIATLLASFGIAHDAPERHGGIRVFADLDLALEWAEDCLLHELGMNTVDTRRVALHQLDLVQGLSGDEIALLARYLEQIRHPAGSTIFRAGDPGAALYAIASGRASVLLEGTGTVTRLSSVTAGAFFGEMALLDRKPRSATLRADTDLDCWVLPVEAFERLREEAPECAIKLLANLARELSARLRGNNLTIQSLAA